MQCLWKYTHAWEEQMRERVSESFHIRTHLLYSLIIKQVSFSCNWFHFASSELCKVFLSIDLTTCCSRVRIVDLLLEMLIRTEFTKQCKEDVERFNHGIILLWLVYRNITHRTYQLRVVRNMHIDFCAWEGYLFECRLHFWIPFLHQRFDIRHILRINHCWRWTCLV